MGITGSWGYLSVPPSTGWSPLVRMTDLFPYQMTGKLLRTLKQRRFMIIPPIQLLALYDNKKLVMDLCRMCKPRSGHKRELIRFKIQEAREKGHTDCLKVLFQIRDSWSLTALTEPLTDKTLAKALVEPARKGQLGLAKYLVSLKHYSLLEGALREPISVARSRGHFHIVDLLVASEANVYGETPLISATMNKDENKVKHLLQVGVNVNTMTSHGLTALEEAALNGCTKIAILLIEAGADVNVLGLSGDTALMLAVRKGNLRMAEVLIKAGADVDKFCLEGHTALSHCAFEGNDEGVRMLVEAGADVNRPCLKDEQDIFSVLVKGADVNIVGESCDTALMLAARNANLNITKVLIEAGADVNKTDENNKTALSYFALNGNTQGVRLLLRSGAKVNMGCEPVGTLKPMIRLLLRTAGQEMITFQRNNESPDDTLHHCCREMIRRHLLKLDRHENLFLRIPRLGLPSRLTKYLLFDTSLDENDT